MNRKDRKVRVAIFEDESMVRGLLEMFLSRRDTEYEVLLYEDPTACPFKHIDKCLCGNDEICTDIIITDIKMPYISGIELIKGQKEKGCKVNNILVISGFATQDTIKWLSDVGCKFLQKPFSMNDLFEVLDEFEENIDFDMIPKKFD